LNFQIKGNPLCGAFGNFSNEKGGKSCHVGPLIAKHLCSLAISIFVTLTSTAPDIFSNIIESKSNLAAMASPALVLSFWKLFEA